MTKKYSTQKALMACVLSLLLCFSMLVGTTFAWFTDSVTSANNIITSGNLDVELEYWNGTGYAKVTNTTKLFDDAALWEPGHTEVAYLKISNVGSLALKYQLNVNVVNEIIGKTATGADLKLSDHLVFSVVEKEITSEADLYTREGAIAAAGNTKGLKTYNGETKALVNNGDANYVALIIYMPTDVGNEANHNGTDIPSIEMGVNVVATQFTAEDDSFGSDYDENAPFSMWDGTVPTEKPETLVVDGEAKTVYVKDAAAFAYLSTLTDNWGALYTDGNGSDPLNYFYGKGMNYYYSGQWTVSLETDIDLGNYPIEPVRVVLGESAGASAFKGNNHTIRNINTTTGLFADKNRVTYSDLTLINVTATNGALTGSAVYSIYNVSVENATISGENYVGGLVGYIYGSVNNCEVVNSSVTATGKEAGGLIGYIAKDDTTYTVVDNTVSNVSVYANNRAAGLIGQVNLNVKVYNNTIDTVTVGVETTTVGTDVYYPHAVVSNALAPENVYDNTVTNANIISDSVAIVDTADELKASVTNGKKDIVVVGAELTEKISLGRDVNATLVDCTITGDNSYMYANNITFQNCTFKTGIWQSAIHLDTLGGELVVNNCTFVSGQVKIGTSANASAVFNNCVFGATAPENGIWSEKGMRFYCEATFNTCEFNNRVVLAGSDNLPLTFNGCTMNGGDPVYFNAVNDGIIAGSALPNVTINN